MPALRATLFSFAALISQSMLAWCEDACLAHQSQRTEFGYHYAIGRFVDESRKDLPLQLAHPGEDIRYVRLLLKPSRVDADSWSLVVRDQRFRPLQVIDKKSFVEGQDTVWTDRFPASFLNISLALQGNLPNFRVDVVAADAMPAKAEHPYYSVKGGPGREDWKQLYSNDFGDVPASDRDLGDVVGMMTTFTGSSVTGTPTWCCSGSIIATEPTTLFLTNFHCGGLPEWAADNFWQGDVCLNTIIDMSWDDDALSTEYVCKRVVRTDPKLDATVLEIEPLTQRRVPPSHLGIRTKPPRVGEILRMIHHPLCLSKRISRNCSVVAPVTGDVVKATDFLHQCDSEGGSSGSPLFDTNGNLIGMHHLGFEKVGPDVCDGNNKAVSGGALAVFLKGLPVTVLPPD